MSGESVFWEDLAADLEDPVFVRQFVLESIRIRTVDSIMNAIDDAREHADLSKAALARLVSAQPAGIRRLFSAASVNPTLGTVSEIAAALGLRVTLEPMAPAERTIVSRAIIDGEVDDRDKLAVAVDKIGSTDRHSRYPTDRGLSAKYSAPRSRTSS